MGGIIMKQFNLQAFLKNPTRPIITRDGNRARIVCTDRNHKDYPIVALVLIGRTERMCGYREDGMYLDATPSSMDLFFDPTKKEGWVNIYKTTTLETICSPGSVFNTKEEALSHKSGVLEYVGTCKIEWEE